jgi:hypothetical protein
MNLGKIMRWVGEIEVLVEKLNQWVSESIIQ